MRVRPNPGASSHDMQDHIRPFIRDKPDAIILMAGSNGISKNTINTINVLRDIITEIRTGSSTTEISVCEIPVKTDKPQYAKQVHKLNENIRELVVETNIGLVKMDKFKRGHLGNAGLHPNKEGVKMFATIFRDYISGM